MIQFSFQRARRGCLSAPGASVLAVLRTDAPESALQEDRAVLILANTEIERRAHGLRLALLASIGATFPRFEAAASSSTGSKRWRPATS